MNFLFHLAAATPGPVPTPTSSLTNDDLVTPGWEGFSVVFLIGVIVILLVLDLVRRLRKLNYRAEIREKLEAEAAAEDAERDAR
jgi:hypothetical protein